ncbi:MAG: thioredoxin-dependent thiol peroxidase [Xanthomonadales bacterium]|nr:thioredoxin-dependent thiol peroxidase [Xanthomonadales bacterium]
MRRTGDRVPDFDLATDRGDRVSSTSLRGRRFVLYFYPKDDTPGCTREACSFRDNLPAFEGAGVPVYGVSADDSAAHARFVHKHGLNFPLLADPDRQLIQAMGVWVEKSLYGRRYFGIARATFVISAEGRIEKVWEKVSPDGHGPEVLAYLRGEAAPTKPAPAPLARIALIAKVALKPAAPMKKPAAKKPAAKKPATKKPALARPAPKTKRPATKAAPRKAVAKKAPARKTGKKAIRTKTATKRR